MSGYYETLDRWYELQQTISRLQDEEKTLREGLFKGTFPDPVEGTNTVELPDGRKLKAVHKIYRNVDEAKFTEASFTPYFENLVFKTKHELSVSAYRKLSDEDRLAVDSVLVIKPSGLPSMELVPVVPPLPLAEDVWP